MRNEIRTALALATLTLCSKAGALTLSESVDRAFTAAPQTAHQISAQTGLVHAAESDRWRRFLPNEPQLAYSRNDDGTSEVLSVTEGISFPGKSLALSRLDRARLNAQRAELDAKRYEIARDVISSYLDAAISSALINQQQLNIADMETLQKSLQARYEAGIAAQAETLVVDLQIRQQRADLVALEDKAAVASAHLSHLLRLDQPESSYLLPDDIEDHLAAELGSDTADQLRSEAAIVQAEANDRSAAWSQLPDFSLGFSRNRYLFLPGSPSGSARTKSVSVGVTVPILFPFSEKKETERQHAQAELDRASAESQRFSAERDREDAFRDYVRSKNRLHDLREKDLPYAEALMESTFSAYKSGKLGIAELVLARKTLTDLRAQDIQLRGEIISAHVKCLGKDKGVRS